MALSASVVWEVRASVGADTNGGAFDPSVTSPGTDYSQQNSAQVAFTDLVIGATTTNLTSVLNPFSSASVGNIVNITSGSGFTTGRYTVVSVSGVTATMDRSVGTTASTGGHGALGGALETLGGLQTAVRANTSEANGLLQVIWVKATASYVFTTPLQLTQSGSVAEPVTFYGYTTTRGDGGQPTITTATNSTRLFEIFSNDFNSIIFRNFIFTNTAGTSEDCFQPSSIQINYMEFTNCTFTDFTNAFDLDVAGQCNVLNGWFLNCTFTSCSVAGLNWGSTTTNFYGRLNLEGCLFNACAVNIKLNMPNYLVSIDECVLYNSTSHNVLLNSNSSSYTQTLITARNSAFVKAGGDGLRLEGTGTPVPNIFWAFNCIFSENTGYEVNFNNTVVGALSNIYQGRNNAHYSTGSGYLNGSGVAALPGDVTLTGDPFVSITGLNFALNSTAGAGAACTGAGWPTTIPGT